MDKFIREVNFCKIMYSNLAKLIPALRKRGKFTPNSINHGLLLEVLDQIIPTIKSTLPEKRSGFQWHSYILVDLYADMTGLSYEKCTADLNKEYSSYASYFQRYNKRRIGNNKVRRAIPDQPSMSRSEKRIASIGLAEDYGNLLLYAVLLYAQKLGFIKDDVTLIADYTEEPCKKDKNDLYCFGTKEGKTKHKTLVFSLISGEFHIVIATYKIHKNQYKLPFFEKILIILKSCGINIKYSLLDRGFYRKGLLLWFLSQRITVIMPARRCADTGKKIRLWLQNSSGRTGSFSLKLKYVKKHGWTYLKMGTVLVGKHGYKLNDVKRDLKSGKITLDIASKRIFPLLIIRGNKHSVRVLDGNANYIRELYRKRWAIEIAFRETHLLGISNWVQNRDVRLLRFTLKCTVYNLWQISREIEKQQNPMGPLITLDEFCGRMWRNRATMTLLQNKTAEVEA